MGGRPCIRGLRVTVGTIVGLLAAGHDTDEVLAAYPYLERDDISQALAYAAWRSEESHGRFELKLLIDMNLSPQWIEPLADAGIEARHWSKVGDGAAAERERFSSGRSGTGSCC